MISKKRSDDIDVEIELKVKTELIQTRQPDLRA